LVLTAASAQTISPLNAAELSALQGDFKAVTIAVPIGAQQVTTRVVSQLNGELSAKVREQSLEFYNSTWSQSVNVSKTPVRVIVGLAGDPIGRGGHAPTLNLPGLFQPCSSSQQLAALGLSTALETSVGKQCLGMGLRAEGVGGTSGEVLEDTPKLNVWTPVYAWSFLKGNDTSNVAFEEARRNPSAQIVWWVYFSSKTNSTPPTVPLYKPSY